jgi:hypothetical protein
MKHKWSRSDDILTFYLFRFGEKEPVTQVGVARHLGFTDVGSLKMRIKNFAAIDGQKGLANYARLSEKVYQEYQSVDEAEHYQECKNILSKGAI